LKTIIFDTETTDLRPGDICQLAYIVIDRGIKARNFYFEVDYINPSAERVHGLSVDKLKQLSGGKRFEDFVNEIEADFYNVDILVGHNVSFDIKFMREEFKRTGRKFDYKSEFCTMKKFTDVCKISRGNGSSAYKYPRLEELITFFKIGNQEIIDKTNKLFESVENDYHDARFDTVAAYLCLLRAKKLNLLEHEMNQS
jgi:DNA polymerase III subunit epsilon